LNKIGSTFCSFFRSIFLSVVFTSVLPIEFFDGIGASWSSSNSGRSSKTAILKPGLLDVVAATEDRATLSDLMSLLPKSLNECDRSFDDPSFLSLSLLDGEPFSSGSRECLTLSIG
jgi:hypothetical protein